MKIRVRAKAGQPLHVTDENGNAIEGLVHATVHECEAGEVPSVQLTIRAPELAIDADDAITKVAAGGRGKSAHKPYTGPAQDFSDNKASD